MFLRQAKTGDHTYLRLVGIIATAVRSGNASYLDVGRKDLLAPNLDALVRLLQNDQPSPRWARVDQLSIPQAWAWGPVLAARHLWDELALGSILDGKRPRRRHGQPLSERAFVLIANRLSHPGSERALAEWLEQAYVCNGAGSRSGSRGGA